MTSVNFDKSVQKRQVFYIPGYDPIHPRRYRELYRTESATQAEISGYDIGIKPKAGGENYGWHIQCTIDAHPVQTQMEVLVWSDIVRKSMSNTVAATYGQLVRTAWTYISTGTLRRLMMMRKGPVIAALYPVGMLLLQLLVAILVGAAVGSVAVFLLTWAMVPLFGLMQAIGMGDGGTAVFGGVAFWARQLVYYGAMAGVVYFLLNWFKAKDGKIYAYYLMHDFAYSARWGGANPPALEERMAAFGDTIAAALQSDVDEVLVVGHSSGAHLAVSILADLIRAGKLPEGGPKLAFLSLGQVVPMVSFLPKAHRLRADLAFLSLQERITWVDVTAPGDGCAFALCDPVAVTGVAPAGEHWPLVMSAAFTQTLSPERWKALRWKFFKLHFQYLCAFDRPKDYDYFQITAGPVTLGARYEGRPPSKSRIDVPVSKYTSVTE